MDGSRTLLTGMSDGGTFTYVSGLEAGSPFMYLASVSAAFHPMLGQMADADQCPPQGIPRPVLMDADRIRRIALVADVFGLDVPTVAGIFWYLDGSCDELALGALETGKALRAVPT